MARHTDPQGCGQVLPGAEGSPHAPSQDPHLRGPSSWQRGALCLDLCLCHRRCGPAASTDDMVAHPLSAPRAVHSAHAFYTFVETDPPRLKHTRRRPLGVCGRAGVPVTDTAAARDLRSVHGRVCSGFSMSAQDLSLVVPRPQWPCPAVALSCWGQAASMCPLPVARAVALPCAPAGQQHTVPP